MNKQFGLLWFFSLLITFYLGYAYKSFVLASSAELSSSATHTILPVNELVADNKIKASLVSTQQKPSSKNKAEKVTTTQTTNMHETLSEIKSTLGNHNDMASIAQAYLLLNKFSEQELAQTLSQLENTANQYENISLLSLLLNKYAETNPHAAMSYINTHLTSAESKVMATMSVVSAWSKNDALSAYDWYLSQQEQPDRQDFFDDSSMALSSIFSELAKQDFQSAVDKLIDISTNENSNFFAVSGIADALTTENEFVELMVRTSELADRRLRDTVINQWVIRSPQEAIEWIDSVEDTEDRVKLQEEVLFSWMISDPTEAANWYLTNAEPAEKQVYVDKVIDNWSWQSPVKALDWLSQQTEIDHNKATAQLVKSSVYRYTDFAINNLDLLTNDKEKLEVSHDIYTTLAKNNKEKAAEFIAQSTMKEALQQRIENNDDSDAKLANDCEV